MSMAHSSASSKRAASSPAETEKSKKLDEKATPVSPSASGFLTGLFSRSKHAQTTSTTEGLATSGVSNTVTLGSESDASEDGEWFTQSSRRERRWSTGRTPGNTPPPKRQPNRAGPNPAFIHKHTTPCFETKNEGAFRSEIEVEIQTINDQPFRGTITTHEAKHLVYKNALGCPFSNFRGLRFGYKGVPIVTFMLKSPVNIDDFASFQFFSFTRSYLKSGKQTEDVLGCKIRGVRTVAGNETIPGHGEDWTRVVKVEGCDYRVSKEMIVTWLSLYGEVMSDVVEDVFEDSEDSEGENATGIYSVKMKLASDIPQLLPMDGRRIKVYYRYIHKLCTKCFDRHPRRECKNNKVEWIDYVRAFIEDNPSIEREMFGKWITILEKIDRENQQKKGQSTLRQPESQKQTVTANEPSTAAVPQRLQELETESAVAPVITHTPDEIPIDPNQETDSQTLLVPLPPTLQDFSVPETDEDLTRMVEMMIGCGMTQKDVDFNIEKRRKLYSAAVKDFNKSQTKKGKPTGQRKNSK